MMRDKILYCLTAPNDNLHSYACIILETCFCSGIMRSQLIFIETLSSVLRRMPLYVINLCDSFDLFSFCTFRITWDKLSYLLSSLVLYICWVFGFFWSCFLCSPFIDSKMSFIDSHHWLCQWWNANKALKW